MKEHKFLYNKNEIHMLDHIRTVPNAARRNVHVTRGSVVHGVRSHIHSAVNFLSNGGRMLSVVGPRNPNRMNHLSSKLFGPIVMKTTMSKLIGRVKLFFVEIVVCQELATVCYCIVVAVLKINNKRRI